MPDAVNHPDAEALIAAPSEREAMDWSLVLLSQGIEPTLLHDDASGSWQLVVLPAQVAAGRESIEQYERENRAWPLRQALPWPGFAFDWTVLGWVLLVAGFFVMQSQPGSALKAAGFCDAALVRSGQWWRLLTATLLHADVGHLATNLVFGALFLGIVLGRFGAGIGLLAATLAGVAGNGLAIAWQGEMHRSLGASGVVLAALGLLAADAACQQYRRRHPRRLIVGSLAAALMLFVLLGVAPRSDVAAHLGGFLAGLVLGVPLGLLPVTRVRNARVNWFAGAALAGSIIVAWWLALPGSRTT